MGMSQIEAAPNSYAGSGRAAFPPPDGDHVSDRVPETYALGVENVSEHASCVQIDTAVVCVRSVEESHGYLTSCVVMGRVEPASWLVTHGCHLKDPRLDQPRLSPLYTWDDRPITVRDMISIQRVALDRAGAG